MVKKKNDSQENTGVSNTENQTDIQTDNENQANIQEDVNNGMQNDAGGNDSDNEIKTGSQENTGTDNTEVQNENQTGGSAGENNSENPEAENKAAVAKHEKPVENKNAKRAAEIFKKYPKEKELFFTGDGTAFLSENDAKNHARSLNDKSIETVKRK